MAGKLGSLPESIVPEIKYQACLKSTAEDKIQIVLAGLWGKANIIDSCWG